MDALFIDQAGVYYSAEEILKGLMEIGANECETLFIHSDIMFGTPAPGFRKKEYMSILWDVLNDLKVKNIIMPSFTFSFCNHEDYDVRNSRTSSGSLNEFIRKKEGRYRTLDPLLSLSVPESLQSKFANPGCHSLGEQSGLDVLHYMDDVKFLFFGAALGEIFTYVHYVEKMIEVPYYFDIGFDGRVIDESGNVQEKTQWIYTPCSGIKVVDFNWYEDDLEQCGLLKRRKLGDKVIACISEKDAYTDIIARIDNNMSYFLGGPFTEEDLIHEYIFGRNGERVDRC